MFGQDSNMGSNSRAAFSDKLEELSDALNLLYITNNASGRHKFRKKWPEISDYLFDKQLTHYDIDGVLNKQDREDRARLEEEADYKRIDLKKTITEVVKNSVDAGSLKFDYIGKVIDKYGATLSTFFYERSVIERVRPGILCTQKIDDNMDKQISSDIRDNGLNDSSIVISNTINQKGDNEMEEGDVLGSAVLDLVEEKILSSEEKLLLSNNNFSEVGSDKDIIINDNVVLETKETRTDSVLSLEEEALHQDLALATKVSLEKQIDKNINDENIDIVDKDSASIIEKE